LEENRWQQLIVEPLEESQFANIVCSYVATDIFPKTPWLTSSTYLYILEQFHGPPNLEVNIADPRQRLVPLFTGHLNFLASEEEDYWFLYLRLPGWSKMQQFPNLIHSWDVARVAEIIQSNPQSDDINGLAAVVNQDQDLNSRTVPRELAIPFSPFPYYEGMNRLDATRFWLGLYWRNNWYDLEFLRATCEQCLVDRIGKICITPWKSFIITGIPEARRLEWEKLLGRFGINARHSSLELNWHLPVADGVALELKQYLVREFDQRDISTYGLTIGISSRHDKPFTSIKIDRANSTGNVDGFPFRPLYNLRYARRFDPNTRDYLDYARGVDRSALIELIIELSRLYFEQLNDRGEARIEMTESKALPAQPSLFYQCSSCMSVYDPAFGDEDQGIPAGTLPVDLPQDYRCWTCGASKAHFSEVELMFQTS